MRLLPIALGLPGTIGFPTAIAHHRSPHGQVTEVSYAGKNIIVYHPSHGNSPPTSRLDCFVDSLLEDACRLWRCPPTSTDSNAACTLATLPVPAATTTSCDVGRRMHRGT